MTTFETAMLFVSVAAAVAATAAALIYRAQLIEMREARAQSERQFVVGSEPILSVQSSKLVNLAVGKELFVDLLIENTGKLTAQDVVAVSRLEIAPLGFMPNANYGDAAELRDASHGTVGAGKALRVTVKGPPSLSQSQYEGLLGGNMELFAHGEVTWLSKLDATKRGTFRFCFQFDNETRDIIICRPRGELQTEIVR